MIARGGTVERFWSAVRRAAVLLCLVALVGGQWGALPTAPVHL